MSTCKESLKIPNHKIPPQELLKAVTQPTVNLQALVCLFHNKISEEMMIKMSFRLLIARLKCKVPSLYSLALDRID